MAVTETRQEAVLIDAGVFIGALLTGDPRHAEARPLVEQAREGILPACTTTSILSEVYGALTWEHAVPRHAPAEAAEAVRLLVEPAAAIVVLMSGIAVALLTLTLAAKYQLTARRVHDARHAATALVAWHYGCLYLRYRRLAGVRGRRVAHRGTAYDALARIAQRAHKTESTTGITERKLTVSLTGAVGPKASPRREPRRARVRPISSLDGQDIPLSTGRRGQPQHAPVGRGMAWLRRRACPQQGRHSGRRRMERAAS